MSLRLLCKQNRRPSNALFHFRQEQKTGIAPTRIIIEKQLDLTVGMVVTVNWDGENKSKSLCMLCKGRHSLATCKAFLEKPFKERQDLYMTRGICFSCLNPGQMYGGQKGSICQNTKQCLKAQTNFQKHKSVYQNTKHFLKNTNQFLKA